MHFSVQLAAGLLLPLTASASWQDIFSTGNSFGVPGVNTTYDYIVVGGGTAGNAIANRLAANGTFSVAVIEAGSFYQLNNGNGSVIPGLSITQHTGTGPTNYAPLIDWDFDTTPQAVRAALLLTSLDRYTDILSSLRVPMVVASTTQGARHWAVRLHAITWHTIGKQYAVTN